MDKHFIDLPGPRDCPGHSIFIDEIEAVADIDGRLQQCNAFTKSGRIYLVGLSRTDVVERIEKMLEAK